MLNGFSPLTNSKAMTYKTNADPSFNNDSPSINVDNLRDAPNYVIIGAWFAS